MQETTILENEQETTKELLKLGWLAGLIDGEGSVILQLVKNNTTKTKFTYHPRVSIYNNDANLISEVCKLLDKYGIKYFVQERASRDPRNNNAELETTNYNVSIGDAKSVKLLLELTVETLQTIKRAKAELCIRFLNIRLNRTEYFKHNREEIDVINKFLSLVGSSTTVRETDNGSIELILEETV